MNILYDDNMPYAAEFFSDIGNAQAYSAASLQPRDLVDVDVLLVRSTLQVDAGLLTDAQRLKFVGTATAGTNHVDKEFLARSGIRFSSAAGCNAIAVAEYVLSTIFVVAHRLNWQLDTKTVGIVGAGFVGTALSQKLAALGVQYYLCDPPLQKAADPRQFIDFETVLQADIICLHVPLVETGVYATRHMFGAQELNALREDQLLINACRGEVLDNAAALDLFERGKQLKLALDVWENEPEVLLPMLPYLQIATAHIAGHTLEGKARGTEMLYQALCQMFNVEALKSLHDFLPNAACVDVDLGSNSLDAQKQAALAVYDIERDDQLFRKTVKNAADFAAYRKYYVMRREYASTPISAGNSDHLKALYQLGFKLKNQP